MSDLTTLPHNLVNRHKKFNLETLKSEMVEAEKLLRYQIDVSKAQGNIHVDQLEYGIESMQGCRVLNLWDGRRGIILSCDNRGYVRIKLTCEHGDFTWPYRGDELRQFVVLSEPQRMKKEGLKTPRKKRTVL